MVAQHYRWDFVGLSTDTKPTPETSEKVVDGSTFYCSDTSKLYVFCKDTWYERKALGGGGGGGTTYTAGDGIDITDDTISVDTDTIQEKLTAGTGIDITDNTISATGGGGGGDTVYSDKSTSDSSTGGAVYIGNLNSSQDEQPDPTATDNHYKYFWALPSTNSQVPSNESINILGTVASDRSIVIGRTATAPAIGQYGVAIGDNATVRSNYGVSLGASSYIDSNLPHSVALGDRSLPTRAGEVNVGQSLGQGYNNTNYRVIGGVHDGVDANDAVTVGQINQLIDIINMTLSANLKHLGE